MKKPKPDLSAQIADALRDEILSGALVVDERLPSETELAQKYDVARGTVREALRQLETKGLLTRRIGSGTFVDHSPGPDGDTIAQATSPIELIDVRLAIEPQIVRLAAINASANCPSSVDSKPICPCKSALGSTI